MNKSNQKGFGLVVILLVVVVIGLVAFAAFRVMNDSGSKSADGSSQNTSESVKSVNDAEAALDDMSIDKAINDEELDKDMELLL